MKKIICIILLLFFSIVAFSQSQERELIIQNETNNEYFGLYFADYIPLTDMYITKEGQAHGDYKYKQFVIRPDKEFDKIFTKIYNFKIYQIKDSTYFELLTFKLDCSRITLELHENYYQIIYKRYNGEVRETRQYLFGEFD